TAAGQFQAGLCTAGQLELCLVFVDIERQDDRPNHPEQLSLCTKLLWWIDLLVVLVRRADLIKIQQHTAETAAPLTRRAQPANIPQGTERLIFQLGISPMRTVQQAAGSLDGPWSWDEELLV